MLKEWKEQLKKEVLPTTWSNAVRFNNATLNYTQDCADRSQLDFDKFRIKQNNAPDIGAYKERSNAILFDREREIQVKEEE